MHRMFGQDPNIKWEIVDISPTDSPGVSHVAVALGPNKSLTETLLAHLNDPNYEWAVTAEDLAHVLGERFFEVYNGHRLVRNEGDAWRYTKAAVRSQFAVCCARRQRSCERRPRGARAAGRCRPQGLP